MIKKALISIIMPCYNSAEFIDKSIASVLDQNYAYFELIIVNDGSTDNSLVKIRQFSDPRIIVINQKNSGVCRARNNALAQAKGDFVAFLDADDTWAPEFLSKLYQVFINKPKTVLAYCGWQNIGLPGGRGAPFIPPDYENSYKQELLFENCRWPIHAALTRRFAIEEAGGFDESLITSEDFLLWLKIGIKHSIHLVPEVLSYYHFHHGEQATKDVGRTAINHWLAQELFLKNHPAFKTKLGPKRIASLMHGTLLHRGYECYWKRDLKTARKIFKFITKTGYGSLSDLKYMLPAFLPLSLHSALVKKMDS